MKKLKNLFGDEKSSFGVLGLILSAITLVTAGGVSGVLYRDNRRSNLMEEARVIADKDGDGVLAKEELIGIYRELGVVYDDLNPRRLKINELKDYLSSYQ